VNPFDLGPETSGETHNYPELQIMLYGQWVVYFYAVWDEYIRHRLAAAHGCNADQIKIEFFGDLRNVRRDVIHKQGIAVYSPNNKVLQWFSAAQPLRITTEQIFELFDLFPRDELRAAPNVDDYKSGAPKPDKPQNNSA
jgi:hypothetical protein